MLMEGTRHVFVRGAVGFVAGVAISSGIGLGIGALMDATERSDVGVYQKSLEAARAPLEEAARNFEIMQQTLGETCMAVIKVYLPGGQLGPSPNYMAEDTVVSDLMDRNDKPCGDTPTKARVAYREAVDTSSNLTNATNNRDHHVKELDMQRRKASVSDNTSKGGILAGSIAVAVGMIAGGLRGYEAREYNRIMKDRYANRGSYR